MCQILYPLGKPYNDCNMEDEEFDSKFYHMTASEYSYQRARCLDICFYEKFKQKCNCSLSAKDVFENRRICKPFNQCYKDLLSFDYFKNCNDFCPLECKSVIIEAKETEILEIKKMKSILLNASETSRALFLYFQELKYTEIFQIPITSVTDLVSNIGGTLGLFLGISLLSFVEFIEFITLSFTF